MDFLKAEIARKKRQMEEKNLVGPDKKYFKRADLMAKEKQEYLDKHQPKKEDLKELEELKELKKKQRGQSEYPKNMCIKLRYLTTLYLIQCLNPQFNCIMPFDPESELTASEEFPDLPRVEVIRRLRERNQPVSLFGESQEESCRRLRQIELDEPDIIAGIRNDFKYVSDAKLTYYYCSVMSR